MEDWQALARILLDSLGDRVEAAGHPVWVRVIAPDGAVAGDQFELALSGDPAGLLGWVAPPECRAAGLVATGTLRASRPAAGAARGAVDVVSGPTAGPGPLPRPGARARMAFLLSREGGTGWAMKLPDGREIDKPPEGGRMVDCLRRCFALPTEPPPAGPGRVHATLWLASILAAIRGGIPYLTWGEVVKHHPAAEILDATGERADPDALPTMMAVMAAAGTWEELRRRTCAEGAMSMLVSPDLAAWMDDGMFARWVLGELPGPDELMAAVRPHVSRSTARRLSHAVHASAHLGGNRRPGAGAAAS